MKLGKPQYIVLATGVALLLVLLSFRTKPTDLISREKERSLNLQSTDPSILRQEALGQLASASLSRVQVLEAQISAANDTADRVSLLQELSSLWFREKEFGLAGTYAQEIAQYVQTDEAWGIAGTTFGVGIKNSLKEKEKSYCLSKALESLENATSLAPNKVSHRLNRGIILVESPPKDNPMKGVLILLDLNKKYPKNVSVINNIAKFALQTGQVDRAEQRLLTAIDLSPNNKTTHCLLAQLYEAKGDEVKFGMYREKCEI